MRDRLGTSSAKYTRTCVQRCRVVGLREQRKSDGSMDVGAVVIRRSPRKSTMCEYLAHKANFAWNENSLRRLKVAAVYLPGDWVRIWMLAGLAKLLFMFSALCTLESIELRRNINAIYSVYSITHPAWHKIGSVCVTLFLFESRPKIPLRRRNVRRGQKEGVNSLGILSFFEHRAFLSVERIIQRADNEH